jgi:two-component system, OmpR family, response regulator TrcR
VEKILIIEDDINLGTPLAGALEMQGFEVLYLTGGENALHEIQNFQPNIVLLDVMLNEDLDGFDIGRRIRNVSKVPIMFTTSRDGNEDFVAGFSIENTDYVRKPYKLMEVIMRIEKMLVSQNRKKSYSLGCYTFFPCERTLKYDCGTIELNNYESAVLNVLCENINSYISREDIIEAVWNEKESKLKQGSLNNIISNLRKYIQQDNHISLNTKIGLGVKLMLSDK